MHLLITRADYRATVEQLRKYLPVHKNHIDLQGQHHLNPAVIRYYDVGLIAVNLFFLIEFLDKFRFG
jgi:hypothetical protein